MYGFSAATTTPSGLKDRVYEYVYGGLFVQLNGVGDNPNLIPSNFTSDICYALTSEKDARDAEKIHLWYAPDKEHRHHACSGTSPETAQSTSLSLSFLKACRQIYMEAHELSYRKNIFSFSKAEVLQGFLESLVQKDRRVPE